LSSANPTPAPDPGAKPRRADAARNRLKILDAARATFAEQGPSAQIDEIARRAGVGVGTVYRHFPTKESLARAMVEQRFGVVVAFVRDELLHEPDPWRAIERSFEFCATQQEQDRGYAELVASIAGGVAIGIAQPAAHTPAATTPAGVPMIDKGMINPPPEQLEEMFALTTELVARAKAAGVVRDDLQPSDMPPFYAALAAIVRAGVTNWRRYVEIVLDGLRPQRPR
jgi:AcrR family transcriptional regulator